MDEFSPQKEAGDELQNLLRTLGSTPQHQEQDVIYGIYDNSRASYFVRLNDYLIDHSRISLKEKAYFFYLLSVMVTAGVPMIKSLKILSRRTINAHFRRIINTLSYLVENGASLSVAMERFPDVFDEAEIGVVASGEAVGHLDRMLLRIARQIEATYSLNLRVRSALIYPSLVLFTLLVSAIIVMTYVIPQLADFFEQSGAALPLLTRALIVLSRGFVSYWWFLLLILLLGFVIISLYVKTDLGKLKWHYYKLRLPGAGQLLRKVMVAKFVRLLGVLIEAGISVQRTMEICAKAIPNELYRRKIHQAKERIVQGKRISDSLSDAPFLFPEIVVQMLYMGENSASLDDMCKKIAKHYDQEVEYAVKAMMSVLEPLTIVLVAIGVVFVAFAVMGPIFALTDIVQG